MFTLGSKIKDGGLVSLLFKCIPVFSGTLLLAKFPPLSLAQSMGFVFVRRLAFVKHKMSRFLMINIVFFICLKTKFLNKISARD